jgi:hypothetical protein
MQKSKHLVLQRERLRNLTPIQLGRVAGGEPNTASLDGLCDSIVACEPGPFNTLNTVNTVDTMTLNTLDNTVSF